MRDLLVVAKLTIFANVFLCLIKAVVGFMFGSVSLISDAINSLGDILTAVIIHVTVKVNGKDPDDDHPFGHTRAESIAGYTIGILMILLAFTVMKYSIEKIITKSYGVYDLLLLVVVGVSVVVKLVLFVVTKIVIRGKNTPALSAIASDHLNDILILVGVFIGVLGLRAGYPIIDAGIGLLIAVFILKTGIKITYDNVKQLMGQSAPKEVEEKIRMKANEISGLKEVTRIKTQYLGNQIQAEVRIVLDAKTPLKKAHDLGNAVRDNIESLDEVVDCFVHIDSR